MHKTSLTQKSGMAGVQASICACRLLPPEELHVLGQVHVVDGVSAHRADVHFRLFRRSPVLIPAPSAGHAHLTPVPELRVRQIVLLDLLAGWLPWLTNASKPICLGVDFSRLDLLVIVFAALLEVAEQLGYGIFVLILAHLLGKNAAAKESRTCTRVQGPSAGGS